MELDTNGVGQDTHTEWDTYTEWDTHDVGYT